MLGLFRKLGLAEGRCAACHRPFPLCDSDNLCDRCSRAIRSDKLLCPLCGSAHAVQQTESSRICGACLISPPPWSRLHVFGLHEDLLRALLLRIKFKADRSLARSLGQRLAGTIATNGTAAEAVLPMPLHPSRLRQRGFNQCHEVALSVSRVLGIPRKPGWAVRLRPTRPQTGLNRAERLRNLDNAFVANPAVRGRRILVLDDTMTTGTSLRRLTESLLQAGAADVEAAVLAVAVLHGEGSAVSVDTQGSTAV